MHLRFDTLGFEKNGAHPLNRRLGTSRMDRRFHMPTVFETGTQAAGRDDTAVYRHLPINGKDYFRKLDDSLSRKT